MNNQELKQKEQRTGWLPAEEPEAIRLSTANVGPKEATTLLDSRP